MCTHRTRGMHRVSTGSGEPPFLDYAGNVYCAGHVSINTQAALCRVYGVHVGF